MRQTPFGVWNVQAGAVGWAASYSSMRQTPFGVWNDDLPKIAIEHIILQ